MKFAATLLLFLAADGPQYTSDALLKFPADYREWVFLSSGSGMTYGPAATAAREGAPLFDNVYVNPSSYRAFMKSGKWPNGTEFVLEIRKSDSHGSINKDGHFQVDLSAIEAEVKDNQGSWKFYAFPSEAGRVTGDGKVLPPDARCYSCHAQITAVENTFVQFYPTLLEVAERLGTVKKDYAR